MSRATQAERLTSVEEHLRKLTEMLAAQQALGSGTTDRVELLDHRGQPVAASGQPIVIAAPAAPPAPPKTDWTPVIAAIVSACLPGVVARLTAPPPDPISQMRDIMEVVRDLKGDEADEFKISDVAPLLGMAKDMFGSAKQEAATPALGGLDLGDIASSLGVDPAALRQILARKAAGDGAAGQA